eukprot:m.122585 g.122585  ORF g.122585 m.122585 type:complete len:512 (+) comp13736_c0_seq3:120-1655(+)
MSGGLAVVVGGTALGVLLVGRGGFSRQRPIDVSETSTPLAASSLQYHHQRKYTKAIVIGGGVVGVSAAVELARQGVQVTLLERRNAVAEECSKAAAGIMQRNNPRVDRATWFATVKSFFKSHVLQDKSAMPKFFIDFKETMTDGHFIRWFLEFSYNALLRNASEQEHVQTNLLQFTDWAVTQLEDRMAEKDNELGKACDHARRGVVKMLYDPASQDADAYTVESGKEQHSVMRKGPLTMAPNRALSHPNIETPKGLHLVAALVQPLAASGHCEWFTKSYADQQKGTFDTMYNVEVQGITTTSSRSKDESSQQLISSIVTSKGSIAVDEDTAVVIAAGSWTPTIGRLMNRYIPVYPMKGYTLATQLNDKQPPLLDHALIESHHNLFFSAYKNQLRVAAVGEFAGWNTSPNTEIAQMLRQHAIEAMPAYASAWKQGKIICGLRPFTSDGSIIIGQDEKVSNAFYNVGPGFNGWKTAVGTAKILTAAITQNDSAAQGLDCDCAIFSPAGRVQNC